MRIHPIRTGQVRIRERMRRGIPGPLRRAAMFSGPWTEPLPILAWAIEHPEGVIVVDTGERAGARDAPFARFAVTAEEEIAAGCGRWGSTRPTWARSCSPTCTATT